MIEQDTIKLLRECDAGVKMGVSAIEDVLGYVHDGELEQKLQTSRREHVALAGRIEAELNRFRDVGKDPNPIAEKMSWIKTNAELMMNGTDRTVASLMTDGCNMGVKSLNRYLNEYKAADEQSKDIAKRLIHLEEQLTGDMRAYL